MSSNESKLAKMLGNGKIDSLDTHLEQFKLNNQANQNELQVMLKEYTQLLDDYKALKKAFEEDGTVNNGIKAIVEEPRNPYVLVLIDGNGYIFNDELVKEKEEGGMKAARMLNDVVEKYLRESLPETSGCRVVVRIYADVTGLSKSLAKSKLIGLEKRSLAAFAAGFTRAINLFDFVDALDEEGTKFKIREMFKLGAEDTACTHILYAACHDASYLAQLVPYSGLRNKITLVQGAGFNSEFHQFSLNVTQFPTIFRWSDLPAGASSSKVSISNLSGRTLTPLKANQGIGSHKDSSWNGYSADKAFGVQRPLSVGGYSHSESNSWGDAKKQQSQVKCKYFSKGFCRYGNKCNFPHVADNINHPQPALNGHDRSDISSSLPTSVVSGFIPLNKDSQRLDTYVKPPTQEEWAIYNTRFRRQKPCNMYHLHRICTSFNCPFDHHDLEPESRHVLEYVLKCSPCPRKEACRASNCFYGHICQKDGCVGHAKGCKMKADMHNVDPKLASMVPSDDQEVLFHNGVDVSVEADISWY